MGKIAFVFSGQGAQYTGMGKSLCEASEAARGVFSRIEALRPGTEKQCYEAPVEELSITANTQPCMFAVELAAASALLEAGVTPDYLAGFSLGEVAAVTFSGALSFEDGFRLVCRRGELMQQAAELQDTAMAAVIKLDAATVEAVCAKFANLYPVNYNCPSQITVAGMRADMEAFSEAIKEAGGRAKLLKVSGGFHSPFMAPAAEGLEQVLAPLTFQPPRWPLYSNYTAQPYAGDPKQLLRQQIVSPVRWQEIVENLISEGVDTFLEVGPGKTLCGLIGRISKEVRALRVEDAATLAAAIEEVKA